MNDIEAKQLISNILDQAQESKSLKFHYIRSWSELKYYIRLKKSTKLIIGALRSSANKLFKDYCKDVNNGTADVNKLLAYSQLQDVIAFYTNELATLQWMLDEYDEYLGQGHFWYSFLGGQRDIWNIH